MFSEIAEIALVAAGMLRVCWWSPNVRQTGRDHETVGCRMKTQGQQALSWYSNNFLLANPDKFQSLNINPRKLDKDKGDKTLSINDLDIANTELIKLLGVHIDENLNFTEHISKLCIKASQKVGVLSRLRNLIPCKAKLLLYKSFILPYLTYCHLRPRLHGSGRIFARTNFVPGPPV